MNTNNRRSFLKKATFAGMTSMILPSAVSCQNKASNENKEKEKIQSKLIVPPGNGLKITGTFLDEISHDIPHQNWGEKGFDF